MANKKLFQKPMRHEPDVDTVNEAGGTAYKAPDKLALAQLASTGTFEDTFYSTAEKQVNHMLDLCEKVEPEFLAKLAVYAKQVGKMKDMPVYVLTYLLAKAKKDESYVPFAEAAFRLVAKTGRDIRNLTLFMRSGIVLGNKSLGSRTQRLISEVLNSASDRQIINWSVGNDPSLADVIKLARPNPNKVSPAVSFGKERRGLYSWVIGKDIKGDTMATPKLLAELLAFQKDPANAPVPPVEFRLLTGMELPQHVWKEIAGNASYMQTRMNLATFHRQGVFTDAEVTRKVCDRLRNPEYIKASGVFPFQQWVAANKLRTISGFPTKVADAMEDAVDISMDNIPALSGNIVVAVDVSGSMSSPVTGYRSGGRRSSTVRCVDAAALVAAGIKRKNPDTKVIAFDTSAAEVKQSHRDSVVTLANQLASLCGGGTNCGAALQMVNIMVKRGDWENPDLVIMVSDNESWSMHSYYGNKTPAMAEWHQIYAKNKNAKFVCLDITPYTSRQVTDSPGRVTVGGFSDEMFQTFKDIQDGVDGRSLWLDKIEAIQLEV